MASGNLNSRTRPHLEENLAKSLKDQSKFNRAQATKLSCRSLNNHWLQASAASDSALPWPTPSDPLIVTDTMLPSCFLKVSAHTELLLVHGSGSSCLQPFHEACLYTSWCPLGVLPSTDNCWLYISCSCSPVESNFTVQFITVKDNHHHPSEE